MKRKDYIKPELAMVEVELQQMIAESATLDTNSSNAITDPDEFGSRDNDFIF